MKARPNSNVQILTEVTDRHVIPVFDIDRTDLNQPQFIPVADLNLPAGGGAISPVYPSGTEQALSGTGALAAVNLTSALTTVSTTGAATSTLAAATQVGLTKTIRMIGDTGDCVITVSGDGIASITLNDVGDYCVVMWNGTGWVATDNNGCVLA